MPGPVSDSYDPEWGTSFNAHCIKEALDGVYARLSKILGNQPPMDIRVLVDAHLPKPIGASPALTEKEWRLLRFAVERAKDSI
jgi:hypothetical protein